MTGNPYQPPDSGSAQQSMSEHCGCPVCGYQFTFRDIASRWPMRMVCNRCSTRLVGNTFILWQAILLVPFIVVIGGVPLLMLIFLNDKSVAKRGVGIAAIIALVAFTCCYVWATLRWGRYRIHVVECHDEANYFDMLPVVMVCCSVVASADERPNIILLMGDDHGWRKDDLCHFANRDVSARTTGCECGLPDRLR